MRCALFFVLAALVCAQDTRGVNRGSIPAHTYASTRGKAENGNDLWSVGTDEPKGVDELGENGETDFKDRARYSNLNLGVKPVECNEDFNKRSNIGWGAIWFGFSGMFFTACYLMFEAKYYEYKTPEAQSQMYSICFVCLIACLAYLTMGTGNGITHLGDCNREFFYARYIDWALTTPLMLLEICYIAGASEETKMWIVGADVTMIAAGVIGSFIAGKEKFYFFMFGMLAFFPITYYLVGNPRVGADLPDKRKKLFSFIAILTALTWSGYPLAWALCEGTGAVSVDNECILYTVLDLVSKCCFGVAIAWNKNLLGAKEEGNASHPPMDDYMAKNLNNWGSSM